MQRFSRRFFLAAASVLAAPFLSLGRAIAGDILDQRPRDPAICRRVGVGAAMPSPNVTADMVVTFEAYFGDQHLFTGHAVGFTLTPLTRPFDAPSEPLSPSIDLTNIAALPAGQIPLPGVRMGEFGSNFFELKIAELHIPLEAKRAHVVNPFMLMGSGHNRQVAQAVVTLPNGIKLRLSNLVRARAEDKTLTHGEGWVFENFTVEAHTAVASVSCR